CHRLSCIKSHPSSRRPRSSHSHDPPTTSLYTLSLHDALPISAPVPAVAIEAEDKAEQIQGQREHPEKCDGGDVLRQVIGHRQQEGGSASRWKYPGQQESSVGQAGRVLMRRQGGRLYAQLTRRRESVDENNGHVA